MVRQTSLMSRRDNTNAMHNFQTTHPQHHYNHCFALITVSYYIYRGNLLDCHIL